MRLGAGFIIGLSVILAGNPAFSQSSLKIDPFPLGEGEMNAAPQVEVGSQKVSERILDQVRRGQQDLSSPVPAPNITEEPQAKAAITVYNAGDQIPDASVKARQQLAAPRAPHALPEPVAAPAPVSAMAPVTAVPVVSAPMGIAPANVSMVPPAPVQQTAGSGNERPGLVKIPVPDWVQFKLRSAAQGESIQDVLSDWSRREHVNLIWRSERDFPVLQPVSGNASYEVSVRALLDQYQGSVERPVASLHIDTQTGARTLLVEMERNG